jgi:hypothetical protein
MSIFLTTIIPDLGYIIIATLFALISYYAKDFLNKHANFIAEQEKALKDKIGVDQYNMDKSVATDIILRIEEEAKQFDWSSEIKHSKATSLISKETGLDAESIYNIIKATVTKIKMGQVKSDVKPVEQTIINNNTAPAVQTNPTSEQGQTVVTNNVTSQSPTQK